MSKLYLVYKVYNNEKEASTMLPSLYAYTTKKKIITQFKEERDMKKFKIVEKDGDVTILNKTYKHLRLSAKRYDTYINNDGLITKDYIEIVSTDSEEEQTYIATDRGILEAAKYTKPYAKTLFNKELVNALDTLEYFNIMEFKLERNGTIYPYIDPYSEVSKSIKNIKVDMFYVFMLLFGNTMKK